MWSRFLPPLPPSLQQMVSLTSKSFLRRDLLICLRNLGNLEGEEEQLKRILSERPDDYHGWSVDLAVNQEKRGRLDEAIELFQAAHSSDQYLSVPVKRTYDARACLLRCLSARLTELGKREHYDNKKTLAYAQLVMEHREETKHDSDFVANALACKAAALGRLAR